MGKTTEHRGAEGLTQEIWRILTAGVPSAQGFFI